MTTFDKSCIVCILQKKSQSDLLLHDRFFPTPRQGFILRCYNSAARNFQCRSIYIIVPCFLSFIVHARCEIILVCRRGMLLVRRMPSSSLTSRTRHNKGLSATDGGWPAPGDVFTNANTHTFANQRVIRPQGHLKITTSAGSGKRMWQVCCAPNGDSAPHGLARAFVRSFVFVDTVRNYLNRTRGLFIGYRLQSSCEDAVRYLRLT